jgi:transcriptional regulator with AAA-type ATPase domain
VLLDELLEVPGMQKKTLGMQTLFEGTAVGTMELMRSESRNPFFTEMIRRVEQDESRHVAFGVLTMRRVVKEASEAERAGMEDWAFSILEALNANQQLDMLRPLARAQIRAYLCDPSKNAAVVVLPLNITRDKVHRYIYEHYVDVSRFQLSRKLHHRWPFERHRMCQHRHTLVQHLRAYLAEPLVGSQSLHDAVGIVRGKVRYPRITFHDLVPGERLAGQQAAAHMIHNAGLPGARMPGHVDHFAVWQNGVDQVAGRLPPAEQRPGRL